ncbi:hypothetical protein [Chondromyces crocatus]|nr:hypothetical protein [Chondromyces crocatus]
MSASLEKPDPDGSAEIYTGGQFHTVAVENPQDTFTPQWSMRVS